MFHPQKGVLSEPLRITAKALTETGDLKPGIAAKLAQLESVATVEAIDLPAFSADASRGVAAIPGLTQISLLRTETSDAAIAAFSACPTLTHLDFNNGSGEHPIITDAGLAGLARLENVKILRCEMGKVTGAGLSAIAGWKKLEELNVRHCPVDDAAKPHLAKLSNLKELNLEYCKISGSAVTALVKDLPQLRLLAVDGIKITDADLPLLAATELTNLSVGDTAITDAGAETLATSKSLKSLSLHDTKITDAGIVALAKMPKLERLMLFRLPLTDASLVALAKAPELSVLWLGDNNFTETGLAKFAAARPKVKVPK